MQVALKWPTDMEAKEKIGKGQGFFVVINFNIFILHDYVMSMKLFILMILNAQGERRVRERPGGKQGKP